MKLDDFKQQELSSNEMNIVEGGIIGTGPLLHPDIRDAVNEFGKKTLEAIGDGIEEVGVFFGHLGF